ncbi:transglycosylase domain-containing protein [Nocardioides donggukensis]|uniref:Transglycosylase domain-containing protein n=1 Tax=Nocardioides donggukensis TaxID=2774019 RepID=A0A927K6V6_9ACTN|nr:transglycosylase domain-containing protein [Nocardioides donggukensis]MBD8870963.1 transglycosylase domain-containing protein [Nocardioides donggukensis]
MPAPTDDARTPRGVLSHLGSMVAVAAVMGVVVAGLAIPFAGVIGISARNLAENLNDLPAELETEALPQRTRILAADGSTIATLYDENRVNVKLTQISKRMRQAILSIEDYRFYQHGALDVKGTVRAFVTNQAAGGVVQGGSSITQQMVKLTLLNQATTDEEKKAAMEDTIARKLRELRYAIAFEENHSKDWILERYLNIAYFGDGVYGVQAAARHFFSKDASKLKLQEAATLAGLVKNPVGFDPTVYPARARDRRNTVLDRMADLSVIKQRRADKLKKRELDLKVTQNRNGCMFSRAPFFCDYVVNFLKADKSLGKTKKERQEVLLSGGLTIRTTLDPRFQKAADDSVRKSVFATDQAIGGLAMVEPRTGNVRALAQSRPMGRDRAKGETFLNYVVNQKYGDSGGFSAGSTFKTFVLATAVKQGIPLTTTINSPPKITISESKFEDCDGEPYGFGTWSPSNSTTSGPKTLYTGTRESVNTFFAQLEARTGICEPYRLAKDLGVDLTNPTGGPGGAGAERVPTFTLGTPNASPLEMAEAYATFAGRGLHCDARPVTKILDSRGTAVKDYRETCEQVLPSAVADAVNDVLRGVQEGGFGENAGIDLNQVSAGKTGTADSQQAVWFVGYTPNLATASMIAGANQFGQPIALKGQTIGGVFRPSASGSGFAGPMWYGAMSVIEQWLDDEDFVKPAPGEIAGVLLPVPNTAGMGINQATKVLEDAGFTVSVGSEVDSGLDRGLISYSSPAAGATTSSGDTVTIYPSDGSPYVPPKPKPKPKKPKNDDKPGRGGGGGGGGRD